jgi:hypothetical protein
MKTLKKIAIGFCLLSTVICLLGGDPWAAMFCGFNAAMIAG